MLVPPDDPRDRPRHGARRRARRSVSGDDRRHRDHQCSGVRARVRARTSRHRRGVPRQRAYRAILRPQRIISKADATAVVHYSVGRADIAKWRSKPGARMIATVDLRSPAERAQATRLRREVRRELRDAGFASLIDNLDANVFMATFVPGLPDRCSRSCCACSTSVSRRPSSSAHPRSPSEAAARGDAHRVGIRRFGWRGGSGAGWGARTRTTRWSRMRSSGPAPRRRRRTMVR